MSDDRRELATSAEADSGVAESWLKAVARIDAAPRPAPALGTKLADGRFTVTRRLGRGGMGVVFEAVDRIRNESVALKMLSCTDAASSYRLKQEFRALADVCHPNLVELHELFAEGGLWFFSMDLIAGVPFDAWIRRHGDLDEARLRHTLPQLVGALFALHGAGKLHRDLKPSNVLVTAQGRVVVLDFGLVADSKAGGSAMSEQGAGVSGTPAYMAPEQADGCQATTANDYYAVGTMLFEAITGRWPFEGRVDAISAILYPGIEPTARAAIAPDAPQGDAGRSVDRR